VRRKLREWRNKGGEGKGYRVEKRYIGDCVQDEENERWERKAMEVKKKSEVWKLINRERKKRKRVNGNIEMEKWKEFFMGLLGRVNNRVVMGRGRKREVSFLH